MYLISRNQCSGKFFSSVVVLQGKHTNIINNIWVIHHPKTKENLKISVTAFLEMLSIVHLTSLIHLRPANDLDLHD